MDQISPTAKIGNIHPIVYKIIQLFRDKKSYLEIAKELDISKGSVASFIRRARAMDMLKDIPLRPLQLKKKAEAVKALPPKPVPERLAPFRMPTPLKPQRIRMTLIDHHTAVTFEELEPHHCKWPNGDPKQDAFRFCGKRRELGSPYCHEHKAASYQKPYHR